MSTEYTSYDFDSNKNAHRLSLEERKPHYVVSEVLQAMQIQEDYGLGTIRISFGRYTTNDEIEVAVQEILRVVSAMWRKKGILLG